VVLTNSSGAHGRKAGEFALMALMMLNDRMPEHMTSQRRHRWTPVYSTPIDGKTVVILGVGGIGGEVAGLARLLGLRVVGVTRSGEPHPACDQVVRTAELSSVLPEADFLLVACPLTPETRGLVGRAALDRMKPGAGIVNMARAAVVDYEALAERLAAGALSGAILDVFDPEPLPEDAKWWDVPRLVVVPHVSSDHAGQYIPRMLDIFFANLRRYAAGERLANVVDRELGY
jgi:phosphoglycerate dehydrogenase-like enzyme